VGRSEKSTVLRTVPEKAREEDLVSDSHPDSHSGSDSDSDSESESEPESEAESEVQSEPGDQEEEPGSQNLPMNKFDSEGQGGSAGKRDSQTKRHSENNQESESEQEPESQYMLGSRHCEGGEQDSEILVDTGSRHQDGNSVVEESASGPNAIGQKQQDQINQHQGIFLPTVIPIVVVHSPEEERLVAGEIQVRPFNTKRNEIESAAITDT